MVFFVAQIIVCISSHRDFCNFLNVLFQPNLCDLFHVLTVCFMFQQFVLCFHLLNLLLLLKRFEDS
jgi:hypothetical protein